MSDPVPPDGQQRGFANRNWRWLVLSTLVGSTFLSYLDRQTLSNAADPICQEFGLNSAQRGELLARFVYWYAAAHLVFGPLADRVTNYRWVLPPFVLGWSACNLLVALARDYQTLLVLRAALGVFEAANFPICLLLIKRIFSPDERVLANGIFYSGGVAATLIAPKFVIYFSVQHHWRMAFIVAGILGLVWLVPWLAIFRHPEKYVPRWIAAAHEARDTRETVATILRRPAFWAVTLVGMGIIPGLYFVTQWLPSYLTQTWKIPYDQVLGDRLVAVSLCQDLGLWIGGAVVMGLARRGLPLLTARRALIVGAYACMMMVLSLRYVPNITLALIVICVYVFGLGAWLAVQQAFKQDISCGRVATVVGFVGFAETLLSAVVVERVGKEIQRTGAYTSVFVILAVLFTGSLAIALIFMRDRFLPQPVAPADSQARAATLA